MTEPIITSRLQLIASTVAIELAVLHGERDRLPQLTGGLSVPTAWPGDDWCNVLPAFINTFLEHPGWCAWNRLIVHREDQILIGSIGTLVPPDAEGKVAIGYYLVPSHRRQGYMREAAAAYIAWLLRQPTVHTITAECLVANMASCRILSAVGFQRDGHLTDEEGEKLTWRLSTF